MRLMAAPIQLHIVMNSAMFPPVSMEIRYPTMLLQFISNAITRRSRDFRFSDIYGPATSEVYKNK